jgi:hypothetical protein
VRVVQSCAACCFRLADGTGRLRVMDYWSQNAGIVLPERDGKVRSFRSGQSRTETEPVAGRRDVSVIEQTAPSGLSKVVLVGCPCELNEISKAGRIVMTACLESAQQSKMDRVTPSWKLTVTDQDPAAPRYWSRCGRRRDSVQLAVLGSLIPRFASASAADLAGVIRPDGSGRPSPNVYCVYASLSWR